MTFGGRSTHLDYLVHKSGRNTSILIITIYRDIKTERIKLEKQTELHSGLEG